MYMDNTMIDKMIFRIFIKYRNLVKITQAKINWSRMGQSLLGTIQK